MNSLTFVVPGPLDQLTGGYIFARHLVEGMRARGRDVRVIELPGEFPVPDAIAIAAAAAALAALPDGTVAVIDGLALAAFADCLAAEAPRLRLLGFMHHPLAAETGLSPRARESFRRIEAALLPHFKGVLCPSRRTAQALYGYGVDHIAVTPPGTMKPPRLPDRSRRGGPLKLLSVATLTPRKGHIVLIEALAKIADLDWSLDCIGNLERDPACVSALRARIAALGLAPRVTLAGEWPPERLGAAYAAADIFVLASYHEGYGMVLAEAQAQGLPIISTRAGAIPETVPNSAGLLVPPGDVAALAKALARVMGDRVLRVELAAGAARAGQLLPSWAEAVAGWEDAVQRLIA